MNTECYLELVKVMEKTEDLIGQYASVESERVQGSMAQLIVVYYSKPFIGSSGTCRAAGELRSCEHRLQVEELEFTQEERAVHDLIYDRRRRHLADSDRKMEPISDAYVDLLSSNVSKIKGHLQAKINQARRN